MNKLVFVIGMRRSGTSILRNLIMQHPDVENIEFEPNELFEVTERIAIPRYRNIPFFRETIRRFKNHSKYYGAKLAINPGIEGMRWKNLIANFPDAKFVFIQRNPENTYKSWIRNEKSKRGTCNYNMYRDWWEHINNSFKDFVFHNKEKAVFLKYGDILKNTDITMREVWKLLGLKEDIKGLDTFIRTPKHGF